MSDRQIVLDASEQPQATPSTDLHFDLDQEITPLALEGNADALMNALFADVDRMLERGVSLPIEAPVEEKPPAPQPVIPLDAILPPRLSPRDLIPQPEPELPFSAEGQDQQANAAAQDSAETKPENQGKNSLWLAILCSSLLLSAGMLCFLFQEQLTQAWLTLLGKPAEPTSPTVAASPVPEAKEDADFLQYIGRSLDRLSRLKPGSSELAQNSPASPSPSPSVVERVYIQVPTSTTTTPSTTTPSGNTVVIPAPAGNSTANPAPVAASPVPSAAPAAVPNIATANSHTLIGVLELGDRSAALFDVNGTPQRIEIGAQVGTSGWTLVSINNQEAIVRRNGEVRSIYVGQKF